MIRTPPEPRRPVPPPQSEGELLRRCSEWRGVKLGEIATHLGTPVPQGLRHAKGWMGQMVETALGATGQAAERDFPHLGIELKTVAVDARGNPRESTYVCTAPFTSPGEWEHSWVYLKLSRVLWVRLEGDGPPAERRVGPALMWCPSMAELERLRADWEHLTELLGEGDFSRIHAGLGEVLQLRPKAANSRDLTWAVGAEGEWVKVGRMGFYLRRSFTRRVLCRGLDQEDLPR